MRYSPTNGAPITCTKFFFCCACQASGSEGSCSESMSVTSMTDEGDFTEEEYSEEDDDDDVW